MLKTEFIKQGGCKFILLVVLFSFSLSLSAKEKKRKIIDTPQDSSVILSLKGDSLMANYDYSHAAIYYQKSLQIRTSQEVVRKAAACFRKLGDNLRCTQYLCRLDSDSLTHTDMRVFYYAYKDMGLNDSTEHWGTKIIERYPYDGEIVASLAAYYNAQGDPKKACSITIPYMDNDTTNLTVFRQHAYATYLLGSNQYAVKMYQKLRRNGYDNYETNFILGICYEEQGKPFEAYEYLLKAAEIKEFNDFNSLYHLGKVAVQSYHAESTEYLNKAIKLVTPDSITMADIYNSMAEVYYVKGEYQHAAEIFEQSSLFTPDRPLAYYNIAQMYHGMYYKTKDASARKKELLYYKKFLEKSQFLEQTEENQQMIEDVKKRINGK